MRPPVVEINPGTPSGSIKQSVSLSSLPPNSQQDVSDVSLAKLRLERPYNSLKKKRSTERDIWRSSWGSGHSHSSCSIHSNATTAGKDDFWAALQTNYNYIMDTNLLDTCKEARGEIENAHELKNATESYACCSKLITQSSKTHGFVGDPRRVRRWLREMENSLTKAPTLTQAIKMKPGEIQKRLREHSDLYREIVSQARVVGACIRAPENLAKSSASTANNGKDEDESVTTVDLQKISNNLKALERRYHLLYLKAFEIQCMLEGLLGKKESPTPIPKTPSDTDEEPVAKLAKLEESNRNSGISKDGCAFDNSQKWLSHINHRYISLNEPNNQVTGFDADSEGSDIETVPKTSKSANSFGISIVDSPIAAPLVDVRSIEHKMETNDDAVNGNRDLVTTSPTIFSTNSLPTTPAKTITATKRTRQPDASKFNRSNRKSKNCAIFYFKHLDTDDNENKGWSSQTSEAFKSGASSEEDEWIFTNGAKKTYEDNSMEPSLETIVPVNGNNSINKSQDFCNLSKSKMETDEVDGGKVFAENARFDYVNGNEPDIMKQHFKLLSPIKKDTHKDIGRQCSKESIQQLVMDAETLVREEILQKSPTRSRHSFPEIVLPESLRKRNDTKLIAHPKIKRVQEWLQHQPLTPPTNVPPPPLPSAGTTDCEASGEYTESDSPAQDSDSSDEPSNSVATCMQEDLTSQCTSVEKIGGSADVLMAKESEPPTCNQPKVVMRGKRRNSDRPWSVSCLSQLTQSVNVKCTTMEGPTTQGLANHSISESAINTLSSPKVGPVNRTQPSSTLDNADSKSSLKKRKMRIRKRLGSKKSESCSNGSDEGTLGLSQLLTSTLVKSESFSGQSSLVQDLSMALSYLSLPRRAKEVARVSSDVESASEEENKLPKPNFRLGDYTTVFNKNIVSKLGSLAALTNYNRQKEGKDLSFTGTDNSNFSEQAWDNYQEKYMSEPYSEGRDSDAARRLLEFGDDYRNFLDSQSDCCSSLSAANNLDSLSPKGNRHTPFTYTKDSKSPSKSPSGDENSNNAIRRRRTIAFEYERRKRGPENARRALFEEGRKSLNNCSSLKSASSKSKWNGPTGRKLSTDFLNSNERRKSDEDPVRRRLKSNEKLLNSSPSSSASSDCDSDDEMEVKALLNQSKNRLEHTEALQIRRHLLRPEDYNEIIATCRDNIRCLEAVLRGPPSTVLSQVRAQEIRDLLSSWESLLQWSENASVARQLQEEMSILKSVLNKLGTRNRPFDSETSIQISIDELKNEKAQLHTHRSTMLRLNASVHSWLTRQEMKMAKLAEQQQQYKTTETQSIRNTIGNESKEADQRPSDAMSVDGTPRASASASATSMPITNEMATQSIDVIGGKFDSNVVDEELHKRLKNEVGDMYSAWDEADQRIACRLESLTTSLIAWKQFESGLNEFKEALGKDKGALKGLKGALEMGNDAGNNLAHDVKEVAKRLSEKMENSVTSQQQSSTAQVGDNHQVPLPAILPFSLKSLSNGSLSDSGISDGGGSSDYGLSEREKRLTALRRLARQLENALAPGSAALNSITQRMEAAEAELRSLQDTCRELIVRTAASQQQQQQQQQYQQLSQQEQEEQQQQQSHQQYLQQEHAQYNIENPLKNISPLPDVCSTGATSSSPSSKTGKQKRSPQSKRKLRRRSNGSTPSQVRFAQSLVTAAAAIKIPSAEPEDPNDPDDDSIREDDEKSSDNNKWVRRVAKYAVPVQLALVALICAVCCLEPHCCDAVNNFSMSFSPQLRYVRGPPPI